MNASGSSQKQRAKNAANKAKASRPNQPAIPCAACPKPNCGKSADDYRQMAVNRARASGAGNDIFKRNKAITRLYADMYNSDPEIFKWAGMAAFASCTVGKGMRQAAALRQSGLPWDPFTYVSGTELIKALEIGNAGVYMDIYWQHLAYQQCGIGELKKAYQDGKIKREVYEAWQKIDQGKKQGKSDLIWQGNAMLLKYEQREVLQPSVYDRHRKMWSRLSGRPYRWFQEFESPIPGDPTNFQDYVKGGDIGDFDDRWKWINESMLPAWKKLNAKGPKEVNEKLAPCVK